MNGECIYRKIVDYMFRTALGKDDFRISCYRKLGRGARCSKVENGPLITWPVLEEQEIVKSIIHPLFFADTIFKENAQHL